MNLTDQPRRPDGGPIPGLTYRHPADDLPDGLWRRFRPRDPDQEREDLLRLQQFIPLTPTDRSYLRDTPAKTASVRQGR